MTRKQTSTMPEIGSRAHRVLVELARHDRPVMEVLLMAAHGLDGLRPSNWRQGPYKVLVNQGLIAHTDNFWQLTPAGRLLIHQVEAEMIRNGKSLPAAPAEPPQLVEPPSRPPFRPLSRSAHRPIRDGALDYRDIPSLLTGRGHQGG